jgi:hypothetical protein
MSFIGIFWQQISAGRIVLVRNQHIRIMAGPDDFPVMLGLHAG